jgi:hypothetical protein
MCRHPGASPLRWIGVRGCWLPLRDPESHSDSLRVPVQWCSIPRMADGHTRRISPQESDASSGWVNTAVAAKALGVAQRTVQLYISRGKLDAKAEGEGVRKTWYVSIDSLNALRARRMSEGKIGDYASEHTSGDAPGDRETNFASVVQNLAARMADEAARAASLEARLELTEQAESTLRETLERERERADIEHQRAEEAKRKIEQAQEDARRLEEEREAERMRREQAEETIHRLEEEVERLLKEEEALESEDLSPDSLVPRPSWWRRWLLGED